MTQDSAVVSYQRFTTQNPYLAGYLFYAGYMCLKMHRQAFQSGKTQFIFDLPYDYDADAAFATEVVVAARYSDIIMQLFNMLKTMRDRQQPIELFTISPSPTRF